MDVVRRNSEGVLCAVACCCKLDSLDEWGWRKTLSPFYFSSILIEGSRGAVRIRTASAPGKA